MRELKLVGNILAVGTQSWWGHFGSGGIQDGGSILAEWNSSWWDHFVRVELNLGGTFCDEGTQTGGQHFAGVELKLVGNILYEGTAKGTKFRMKVYGGDWSRATLLNCIFTKDFSCPASNTTRPFRALQDTMEMLVQMSTELVAERINWLQGEVNQSKWTGIKVFGCFYEDGAILSGIPADVRAKIRPIEEMGLPPAPIYKSNTRTIYIRYCQTTSQ